MKLTMGIVLAVMGHGQMAQAAKVNFEYNCQVQEISSEAVKSFFSTNLQVSARNCTPLNLAKLRQNIFTVSAAGREILQAAQNSGALVIFGTTEEPGYGGKAVALNRQELPALDPGESALHSAIFTSRSDPGLFSSVATLLDRNNVAKVYFTSFSKNRRDSVETYSREINLQLAKGSLELRIEEFGEHFSGYGGRQSAYTLLGATFMASARGQKTVTLNAEESRQVLAALQLARNSQTLIRGHDIGSQDKLATIEVRADYGLVSISILP